MLADRIADNLGERFQIPPPPTLAARLIGNTQIGFSRFQNLESRYGDSAPSEREDAFAFIISLRATYFSRVVIGGSEQSVVQSPGEAYLFDLNASNQISLDGEFDSIRFYITQAGIDQMAEDKGNCRIGGLHAKSFGQADQILHRLAMVMIPAIEKSSEVTTAFVEYMGLAFYDHVAHTYGGAQSSDPLASGLGHWHLGRACEFIESNLAGDLSIAALATECGMSMSHFTRAFHMETGMTPHQWIIHRRLSRAKILMQNADLSLSDIACACGFADQSHLGRHFVRATKLTPAQWRRQR
ncbi:helix-turn-helix transcriptional regulator [Acidisoma cellulosilytica]|uniref:Helix-turn-helix transcriptional regulator n=1 Tax=Acidisoma cellulosilyticum TaxID=2802395 RepID=A0A963Z713_9PROT|nr:AraC family transcriptional regulator [Acidisoma cellulosilyticum]MCB8883691.1 helix-turn-helix transcriptional regulator [Acidisoma cellulosilyticum]